MPHFDYRCEKCNKTEEKLHRISEQPDYFCTICNTKLVKIFAINRAGFILKGGTAAIHYKEKRLKLKQNEEISKKQKARYGEGGPKIQPNIAGVEVDSWSDAKKLAKEAGLNHDSYTPYAEKEKSKLIV